MLPLPQRGISPAARRSDRATPVIRPVARVLTLLVLLAWPATGRASNAIRISQVYGGGGGSNSAATYARDYVELYNDSASPVDISGWCLEYGSATGNWGSSIGNRFTFPGGTIIQAGHYLMIATGTTGTGGGSFPVTPDIGADGGGPTLNLSLTTGKVGLFSQENANLACGAELPGTLVDKVAYGTSNCAEGTAVATLSISSGAVRNGDGTVDTDNNVADFTVVTNPTPRNSSYVPGGSLPAPTNLQASTGCNSLMLTWDAVPGAVAYRVTADGIFQQDVTSGLEFQDVGHDHPVLYGVAAVDGNNLAGPEAQITREVSSAPPAGTLTASTTAAWAGQPVRFSARSLERVTSPVTWQRYVGTTWETVTPTLDGRIQILQFPPDSSALVISSALSGDAGVYSALLDNVTCNGTDLDGIRLYAGFPDVPLPPPASIDLQATGCRELTLSWDPVPYAVAYIVTGQSYEFADTLTATSLVMEAPVPGPGRYEVAAVDMEGHAGTPGSSADVEIPWPPTPTTIEGATLRLAGDTITLTALPPEGVDPASFSYDWRRNGVSLGAPDSETFTLSGATPAASGDYAVIASNACGADTSNVLTVTVVGPPTGVTATPNCQGITVAWTMTPGVDHYSVSRNGVEVATATTSPWIDTTPLPGPGCYVVRAVLADARQTAPSPPACATSLPAAPTVSDPLSQIVEPGAGAVFTVTTTGSNLTYTWRKLNTPIAGAPNGPTLTKTNVQPTDTGVYSVIVCNSCGCDTSAPALLRVCARPVFESSSRTIDGAGGAASTILSGTVTGAATTAWYRQGAPLADGAKFTGTQTTSLTILNLNPNDAGLYELRATAACGLSSSIEITLRVLACAAAPSITTQPVDQSVSSGPASFSVTAAGCAPLKYQWQKQNKRGLWQDVSGATSSTFSIASVTQNDDGVYRCRVTDPQKRTVNSLTASLNVPVIFLSLTARAVACDLARVRWELNYPASVQIQYGPDCGNLLLATSGSATSRVGTATIHLQGPDKVRFVAAATTATGQTTSECRTTYFQPAQPSLVVSVKPRSWYGTIADPQDALLLQVTVKNSSCRDITGPIEIRGLTLRDIAIPRTAAGGNALPLTVSAAGLAAGQSITLDDLYVLRSEIGAGPHSTVMAKGSAVYNEQGPHTVVISASVVMP